MHVILVGHLLNMELVVKCEEGYSLSLSLAHNLPWSCMTWGTISAFCIASTDNINQHRDESIQHIRSIGIVAMASFFPASSFAVIHRQEKTNVFYRVLLEFHMRIASYDACYTNTQRDTTRCWRKGLFLRYAACRENVVLEDGRMETRCLGDDYAQRLYHTTTTLFFHAKVKSISSSIATCPWEVPNATDSLFAFILKIGINGFLLSLLDPWIASQLDMVIF